MSELTTTTDTMDLTTLANEINAEHRACDDALRTGLNHAVRAGELLNRAKSRIKHGSWGQWLEDNFEGSSRTAQAYMKVAREVPTLEGAKAQRVADLSFRGALKELSESAESKPQADAHTFEDGAEAMQVLAEIRDTEAWRPAGYESFEDYMRKRWNMAPNVLEAWEEMADDPPRILRGASMEQILSSVRRISEIEMLPSEKPKLAEVGRALKEVEGDELYKLFGYGTFSEYCAKRLRLDYRARAMLALFAELDEIIPFDETETGLPYIPEDLPWESYVKGWEILTEIERLSGAEEEEQA
ncbi:MAG: DUF3102 domain-containing protein [Rubrobacteraceae bacterium]